MLFAGAIVLFAGGTLLADPARQKPAPASAQSEEKLVFVTGSLIPQRVKIKQTGSSTTSPLRVIDRREIDGTGRFTTRGAFANEPSVRIVGH